MTSRWIAPLLLAVAAPSGIGGAATGSFGIEVRLQAVAHAAAPQAPVGSPRQGAPITCSTTTPAGDISSVQVRCNTPTFVQISGLASGSRLLSGLGVEGDESDACGQLANVPGFSCVTQASNPTAQRRAEGVSLFSADIAVPMSDPADPSGSLLYEVRRRDSLGTLVAVQTVDPASGTVELLVTF